MLATEDIMLKKKYMFPGTKNPLGRPIIFLNIRTIQIKYRKNKTNVKLKKHKNITQTYELCLLQFNSTNCLSSNIY